MKRKLKRRPGAGRKPLGSTSILIRITTPLLQQLDRLVANHGTNRSLEIRAALHYRIMRYQQPALHVEALACMLYLLVKWTERETGKRWIDDSLTGAAVREGIERLIFHFAPTAAEPVTIPPEIKGLTGKLITLVELLRHTPGVPDIPANRFEDETLQLAQVMRDIGSGWKRNRSVWFEENPA
jgi:hypothetical protein